MDEYDSSTAPVIAFYDKLGVVSRIDGAQPREQVFAEIQEALGKLA